VPRIIDEERLTAWAHACLRINHLQTLTQREIRGGSLQRACDLSERARLAAWTLFNEMVEAGASKPPGYAEPGTGPEPGSMEPDQTRPPLAPAGDEIPVQEQASFEADCMAALKPAADHLGYAFTKSVLTSSAKWGLIWRADFLVQGRPPPGSGMVNRALAWRPANATSKIEGLMTAFGQRVAPL